MNKWFFLKRKKPIIPLYSNNYNLRQKSKLSTIQYIALENVQTEHFFLVSTHVIGKQFLSPYHACWLLNFLNLFFNWTIIAL